jgi:hypothetical protein
MPVPRSGPSSGQQLRAAAPSPLLIETYDFPGFGDQLFAMSSLNGPNAAAISSSICSFGSSCTTTARRAYRGCIHRVLSGVASRATDRASRTPFGVVTRWMAGSCMTSMEMQGDRSSRHPHAEGDHLMHAPAEGAGFSQPF